MRSRIDHLVVAGGDLAELVSWFTEAAGVEPSLGGAHPGLGTRNALVALGPRVYLELIGPDADQPQPTSLRRFGIDGLSRGELKLATFAVAVDDIDDAVSRLALTEALPGPVESMSRVRPDGGELSWRVAIPSDGRQYGVVPFLIEWGSESAHPAEDSTAGCTLHALSIQHPEPDFVSDTLSALGLDAGPDSILEVTSGHPAVLSAALDTPNGILRL